MGLHPSRLQLFEARADSYQIRSGWVPTPFPLLPGAVSAFSRDNILFLFFFTRRIAGALLSEDFGFSRTLGLFLPLARNRSWKEDRYHLLAWSRRTYGCGGKWLPAEGSPPEERVLPALLG